MMKLVVYATLTLCLLPGLMTGQTITREFYLHGLKGLMKSVQTNWLTPTTQMNS